MLFRQHRTEFYSLNIEMITGVQGFDHSLSHGYSHFLAAPKTKAMYTCPGCAKDFTTEYGLATHFQHCKNMVSASTSTETSIREGG